MEAVPAKGSTTSEVQMEASLDDPEATGLTAGEDSVRYGRVTTSAFASALTCQGGCPPFLKYLLWTKWDCNLPDS